MTTRNLGALGENLAAQLLLAKGYQIIERNWRVREGEIDIIAMHFDTIVFVEVKTRIGDAFGLPEEAVDAAKQGQLLMLGQLFMADADEAFRELSWRIDVIAIELTVAHRVRTIRHFEDAVRFES